MPLRTLLRLTAHIEGIQGRIEHGELRVRLLLREAVRKRPHHEIRYFITLLLGLSIFVRKSVIHDDKVRPVVVEVDSSDIPGNADPEYPDRVCVNTVEDFNLVLLPLFAGSKTERGCKCSRP